MLSKMKTKVRAVIHSEAKKAMLDVWQVSDKELVADITAQVQQIASDSQSSHEANMKKMISEEISHVLKAVSAHTENPELSLALQAVSDQYASSTLSAVSTRSNDPSALATASKKLDAAIRENNPEKAAAILTGFAKEKQRLNAKYLDEASKMRTAIYKSGNKEAYKDAEKVLFDMHSANEFTREQFADVYNYRFPVMQPASLIQQFVRRRRMKQIGNVPDRWLTKSKQEGEEFAQKVGVLCPKSQYNIPFDEIPRMADIVIKPMSSCGSKGVYLVRALDDIISVEDHVKLNSWEEMRQQIQKMLKSKRIGKDAFVYQQCIYSSNTTKEPAHDLKFYTFYGEVGAVLEIARYPEKAFWWWTPDGQLIEIEAVNPACMKPEGFTPEMLQTAIDLSLKIPSPFMRLDFLRNEDKIYFGEFCSMPGAGGARTLGRYYPKWDRIFGNLYLKAEMRIVNDLLTGKRFDEINEFNRICDIRYNKK